VAEGHRAVSVLYQALLTGHDRRLRLAVTREADRIDFVIT